MATDGKNEVPEVTMRLHAFAGSRIFFPPVFLFLSDKEKNRWEEPVV